MDTQREISNTYFPMRHANSSNKLHGIGHKIMKISILLSPPLLTRLGVHTHRFSRCERVLASVCRQEHRWGPVSMSVNASEQSQDKCLTKKNVFLKLLWCTNFLLPKVHPIFTTCFATRFILQICIFAASISLFAVIALWSLLSYLCSRIFVIHRQSL